MWPYLTRSSGLVATVLIVLALGWGLLFSARATGNRRRPNWWLDLHNYLGGLAFVFTVVHVLAAYRDKLSGIGLTQIFVPMTAAGWQWGITWGVLAVYMFAAGKQGAPLVARTNAPGVIAHTEFVSTAPCRVVDTREVG